MIKFHQPYSQDSARQEWSIEGVQVGKLDTLTSTWTNTHVEIKSTEPLVLKKGYNKIVLPSLSIKDVVIFVELAQELLDAVQNVKAKHIYSVSNAAPEIVVFVKDETTITHIADLYMAKGSFQ